jgi:hypothetical protein
MIMILIQRCLGVLGITVVMLLALQVPTAYAQSCDANCGFITEEGCACDDECVTFGDCCADKDQFCNIPPPIQPAAAGGDPEPAQYAGIVAAHNS